MKGSIGDNNRMLIFYRSSSRFSVPLMLETGLQNIERLRLAREHHSYDSSKSGKSSKTVVLIVAPILSQKILQKIFFDSNTKSILTPHNIDRLYLRALISFKIYEYNCMNVCNT